MKKLLVALIFFTTFNVGAATVVIDETTNPVLDTTFIDVGQSHLDTTTGLEWLDFGSLVEGSMTFGHSINSAVDAYSEYGWRLATYTEVYDLFDMFFPTFDGGTTGTMTIEEGDGTNPLLSSRNSWIFGFGTDAEVLIDGTVVSDTGFIYSTGLYVDENGNVDILGLKLDVTDTINTTFYGPDFQYGTTSNFDLDTARTNLGVFMVRDYTVVPIPAAAWLFLTGLVMLVGFGRKRESFDI